MLRLIQMNTYIGQQLSDITTPAIPTIKLQQSPPQDNLYDPLDTGEYKKRTQSIHEDQNTIKTSYQKSVPVQREREQQQNYVKSISHNSKKQKDSKEEEKIKQKIQEKIEENKLERIRKEKEREEHLRKKQKYEEKSIKSDHINRTDIKLDRLAEIKKLKLKLKEQSQKNKNKSYSKPIQNSSNQTKHAQKGSICMNIDPVTKVYEPSVKVINIADKKPIQSYTVKTVYKESKLPQKPTQDRYDQINKTRIDPLSKPREDPLNKPRIDPLSKPRPELNILKPKLNILAKRQDRKYSDLSSQNYQHKHKNHPDSMSSYSQEEEDEDRDLSDFVVDDDEVEEELPPHQRQTYRHEMQNILKNLGAKRKYISDSDISDDSNMEANYETIEMEEKYASRMAKKEDLEQQKLIELEEKRDRMERRIKKRQRKEEMKRRQKLRRNDSDSEEQESEVY